jgi:hypothetical protein
MLKQTIQAFVLGFGLLQSAAAAPSSAVEGSHLSRRDNDGVYLTNCVVGVDSSFWSQMSYYNNLVSGSQNGQFPDDTSVTDSNGETSWEGQEVCGTFSDTGVQFCSFIESGAQNLVCTFLSTALM